MADVHGPCASCGTLYDAYNKYQNVGELHMDIGWNATIELDVE